MDATEKAELIRGIANENYKLTRDIQTLFLNNVEELRVLFENTTKDNKENIRELTSQISTLSSKLIDCERQQSLMKITLRSNAKKLDKLDDETELRILLKYKGLIWVLTIGSVILVLLQVIPGVMNLLKH